MVSSKVISEIRRQVNIVDVISTNTSLSRAGTDEYKGSCPFHRDANPSFFVNTEMQVFHCFSCGRKGNVITYVEEMEKVNFSKAVQMLAIEYNIPLTNDFHQEDIVIDEQAERYQKLMKTVNDYFQQKLVNNKEAKDYLASRKLNDDDIKRWQIGYDDGNLYSYLMKQGHLISELEPFGLINVNDSDKTIKDAFANRITFPIFDNNGNVVAFSARTITNALPKYKNTKTNQFFEKGKILFNLSDIKDTINSGEPVYIFEGQNDVVSAVKSGVTNSVSSLGTALTVEQIGNILDLTDNIVIVFDSDEAGFNATKKAIENIRYINNDTRISISTIPEDMDPDDYRRKYGEAELKEVLEDDLPVTDYYLSQAINDYNSTKKTIQDKAYFVKNAREIINKYSNVIEQEFYNQKINSLFGISINAKPATSQPQYADEFDYENEYEDFENAKPQKTEVKRIASNDNELSEIDRMQLHVLSAMINNKEYLSALEHFEFPDKSFQNVALYLADKVPEISNYEMLLYEKARNVDDIMSEDSFIQSVYQIQQIYSSENQVKDIQKKLDEAVENNDYDGIVKYAKLLQKLRARKMNGD